MKRAVILCLPVLISFLLLVKCDDEGTWNTDDEEGNNDANNDVASSGHNSINTQRYINDNEVYDDDGTDEVLDAETKLKLMCFVCRAIIETMHYEIRKVNPRKRIEVSTTRSIQYSKSESYLAELMEDLCEYEDTFAILRQVLVQKTFIAEMLKNNGSVDANPGFSQKSLSTDNVNYLCLEILGAHDDAILAEFQKEVLPENIEDIICTETAKYCEVKETEADNDKERDEL